MTVRCASVLALSLFAFALPVRGAEPPVVKFVAKQGEPLAVQLTGIDKTYLTAITDAKLTAAEWPKVARLVVDTGTPEEVAKKPPVAGEWLVKDGALRFEPQFPLVPGVKYRVFCDFGAIPRTKLKGDAFSLPAFIPKPPPGPRVQVLRVDPSANRLPENTLRVYLHFSGQVKHGDVYSRVKITRDDGKVIARPFVELDEELWSEDGLRLTLIFDPGRVKRGLGPREEFGPILEEGRSFALSHLIRKLCPTLEGRPLLLTTDYKKNVLRNRPGRRTGVAGRLETGLPASRVGRPALGSPLETPRPRPVEAHAVGGRRRR